jgi:hypothetical protein
MNNERDEVYWKWTPSKKFTGKSMYEHLTQEYCGPNFKSVWKAKIPEKNQNLYIVSGTKGYPYERQHVSKKLEGGPFLLFLWFS